MNDNTSDPTKTNGSDDDTMLPEYDFSERI